MRGREHRRSTPRLADAAIVATSDTQHVEPAIAALEAGYHVLLEKPMAPSLAECRRLVDSARRHARILQKLDLTQLLASLLNAI